MFPGYILSSPDYRRSRKDSPIVDSELRKLFDDLQKQLAETRNITEKLGITDGKMVYLTCLIILCVHLKCCNKYIITGALVIILRPLLSPWSSVFEQRDAAEYFEKILCMTSQDASKVRPIYSSVYFKGTVFINQCWNLKISRYTCTRYSTAGTSCSCLLISVKSVFWKIKNLIFLCRFLNHKHMSG